MKKICFVVQRYGLEVNGGAELHCRAIAEHLKNYVNIDIVTTCAIDYLSWQNEYNPGISEVNGIRTLRFSVDRPRNIFFFNLISKVLFTVPHCKVSEMYWMKRQGPESSELLNYIKNHHTEYDCFIFFTYLYYTTFFGLPLVKDRSILIPTAHDDLPIKFSIFKETFSSPQMILFNTNEEKEFVHNKFDNSYIDWDVVGVGIDPPNNSNIKSKKRDNLCDNYVVYVGRIDVEKGCQELFAFFIRFKTQYPSDLKLLLIGKTVMPIPIHSDIIHIGFVDELTKYQYITNATLLIMPSPYESLSMVLLESWYCNRPVLVNGRCEVLKGQCTRSGGGFWYNNYKEFSSYLHLLIIDENKCISMGINGHRYVVENYSWDNIIKKYLDAIDTCISKRKFPISNCNTIKGLK